MRAVQRSGLAPGVPLSGASELDSDSARRDGADPILTSRRARSQRIAGYAIAGSASYGFGLVRPDPSAARVAVWNRGITR